MFVEIADRKIFLKIPFASKEYTSASFKLTEEVTNVTFAVRVKVMVCGTATRMPVNTTFVRVAYKKIR